MRPRLPRSITSDVALLAIPGVAPRGRLSQMADITKARGAAATSDKAANRYPRLANGTRRYGQSAAAGNPGYGKHRAAVRGGLGRSRPHDDRGGRVAPRRIGRCVRRRAQDPEG